ncbi:MAG: MerR family transcriptional regulator [Coprobacillus sp.]
MKINELCEQLHLTKKAIYYYEEEGLINPTRLDNNYREYNPLDFKKLQLIHSLRVLDISVDEIKQIFNNEISLIDCLETKKQKVYEHYQLLNNMIETIEHIVERQRCHLFYIDYESETKNQKYLGGFLKELPINTDKESYLLFKEDYIEYFDEQDKHIIYYKDITSLKLSMCSRLYNTARPTSSLTSLYTVTGGWEYMHYLIDFDIETNDNIYKIESRSRHKILEIINLLYDKLDCIHDPLNLHKIFNTYTDKRECFNYIHFRFRDWAKEYHLDSPRTKDQWKILRSYFLGNNQ